MIDTHSPPFLRRVLWFDAVTCLISGLGLLVFAGLVQRAVALPYAFNLVAGTILLVFGAAIGYVASGRHLSRPAVWWIASLNGLWAAASVLALLAGWLAPNTLGTAFVIVQAVAVGVIAELQVLGLRRGTARPANA